MPEHIKIRCAECEYVRINEEASRKRWTAYVCGNENSEYYKTFLNVSANGDEQKRVTFGGCKHGRKRVSV